MRNILVLLFVLTGWSAMAQKTIVIMGSSSALGAGATTGDSSWAGRLTKYYQQNTTDGVDTTVVNIALFGAVTYQEMPAGFVPTVANRPSPDPAHNVTLALSYNPDIVIINLPSNDIVNLVFPDPTVPEIMSNFRLMYNTITATGAKCFITTTQPRNDIDPSTHFYQRQELRDLRDSIIMEFGIHSINVWDDLVSTDGLYSLRDDVRDPASQYHLNNTGHRYVFQEVVARNIFTVDATLPVSLTDFRAAFQNGAVAISWRAAHEEAGTRYELQRSTDGSRYQSIFSQNASNAAEYNYADQQPAAQNFYRLKIVEPGQTSYSRVLVVNQPAAAMSKVFLQASGLHLSIGSRGVQPVQLRIINTAGTVLVREDKTLQPGDNQLVLPVSRLAAGAYFVQVYSGGQCSGAQGFVK